MTNIQYSSETILILDKKMNFNIEFLGKDT